jgi:hypothetical protein
MNDGILGSLEYRYNNAKLFGINMRQDYKMKGDYKVMDDTVRHMGNSIRRQSTVWDGTSIFHGGVGVRSAGALSGVAGSAGASDLEPELDAEGSDGTLAIRGTSAKCDAVADAVSA